MICRKCEASATVLIKKEYWYCDNCFIINTNHKFRACLGKSKSLSPNEKVLICLSGGASSTVLLDLINCSITLNGTKRLRINPYFLHLVENATVEATRKATSIMEQCKKYNFDVYLIDINEYYSTKITLPEPNNILINSDNKNMMQNISSTINHDVMTNMKRNLFLRVAKELQCKVIFTAETTTVLAMRLLSNLSIGRGSQVENDIGFIDKRDEYTRILRPMKDITKEEIHYFIKIKKLNPIQDNKPLGISLQSVIESFVLDLQENYPSTISTVCKTADKIESLETTTNGINCTLCQSNIELTHTKLTAVEATMFSQQMCFQQTGAINNIEPSVTKDNNSMFPCIYKTLCYSCSRNVSELNKCKISAQNVCNNKNI